MAYSGDNFLVNNPGMDEVTFDLAGAVTKAGQLLEGTNQVLNTTAQATQNSGLPLWDDLRSQWSGAYDDMVTRLHSGAVSTGEAHDLYKQGDSQVVRIMS